MVPRRRLLGRHVAGASMLLGAALAGLVACHEDPAPTGERGTKASAPITDRFNQTGNYLIADQFNNRVIEVAPNGDVVWSFGLGPRDFTAASIIGVNDAQRVGSLTLMAGTGTPGGQPEAPQCTNPNGCPDNRVLLVDEGKNIIWQYGQFGVTGSGPNQLNTPVQNTWLPNGHVLITDQGNQRIIEVNLDKEIVWHYGNGRAGSNGNELNNPNCAELLANGDILICDENNNRAIEVTHDSASKIVWEYGASDVVDDLPVSGVAFASRLSNGHTLITDSGNARILEVDANKNVAWKYYTNRDAGSNPRCITGQPCTGPLPTRAVRLANGHTLISDQYNHRVIEVDSSDPQTAHDNEVLVTFGALNALGYDTSNVSMGGLNSPYDAKLIGDYTGLTPPFGF